MELLLGFGLTIISLLIGFQLGKDQRLIPEKAQRRIEEILTRTVQDKGVGAVERPTAQDNYYRDNPKVKIEDDVMNNTIEILNK